MKLKYSLVKGKKVYTLKETINGEQTKDAHHKFLRLKDAPKTELD